MKIKVQAPAHRNVVHTTAQRCGAGYHKNKKDHEAKDRRSRVRGDKAKERHLWRSFAL